jgi:methylthioribulose 1-phosphate dehydratase/enolase-phosphatase E1
MVVPIVENTARECELTDRMRAAIQAYPRANAVLVRRHGEPPPQNNTLPGILVRGAPCRVTVVPRHSRVVAPAGVYVWGKDWIAAKTQAECYHYLFEAAVKMAQLGIDASKAPAPLLVRCRCRRWHANCRALESCASAFIRCILATWWGLPSSAASSPPWWGLG